MLMPSCKKKCKYRISDFQSRWNSRIYHFFSKHMALMNKIWKDNAKETELKQDKYLCFNLASQESIALGKDLLLY